MIPNSNFQVKNQFNSEFLKLFNDLVVFPFLSMQNHIAICRLQLRDVAESMSVLLDKKVILYPSDAAVVNMMNHDDIIEVSKLQYLYEILINVIGFLHSLTF